MTSKPRLHLDERCPLTPLGMPRCDRPAFYEMDIDRDEKWIPLCVEHGPMYRRSSNVRIRTRRTAAVGRCRMTVATDRWTCPNPACNRTVVIHGSQADVTACIAAAQRRHAAGHAAGAQVARQLGLADPKTTRGKK